KKSNNNVLNDEVGGTEGADCLGKDLGDEVKNVTLTQDKCNEVCEEVENKGTGVNETNSDKEANLVQPTPDKNNVSKVPVNIVNSSYAKVLNKSLDNKLMLIPTENGVDGIEVVIFDDEIVKEGSKKWELNVCVYFVGYKMSYQEHIYNLSRMWGKFGLKQFLSNGNGVFLFKFKSENGINDVIKSGPWMVNAWSTKGISAISSRLGNPLIMDQVTTNMCNMGNGRAGFARVLIEVEACKGLLDQIEIVYRNKEIEAANEELRKIEEDKRKEKEGKEEFTQVNRKKPPSAKQVGKKNRYMQGVKKDNVTYQPVKRKVEVEGSKGNSSVVQETEKVNNAVNESPKGNDEDDNVVQNEEDDEGEVAPPSTDFMDVKIASWNIRGLGKLPNQNAVKNLLNDEKLGVCVVLETRLKGNNVKRIRDIVFSRWSWLDNAHCCSRGCRIMVGWNNNKKIDRVMRNEEFFYAHRRAHVVFLPYGNSDHSPVVLTCSKAMKSPSRSFRFANYVADKEEFKTLVEGNWNIEVEGFAMYKLVKKLKAMKAIMNNLNWKNGNLCDKVKKLKSDMDTIQISIDNDPHNESLRRKGVDILGEYSVALEDEEKLMFQRAKVQWLNDGDRNSAFFHKATKGRINKSRVEEIWGTDNVRYVDDQVPIQFVNHFKSFLGPQQDMECLEMDSRIFKNKIELKSACDMIKEAWNIVSNDVCRAVEEFFLFGKLLGELNATIITLVPKVYWASVFKLPKVVIKDIERIFKGFLWNQGELQKGKAKVSWKDVCQPKKYGGLGFKPLEIVLFLLSTCGMLLIKRILCGWSLLPTLDTIVSRRKIYAAGFSNDASIADCIENNGLSNTVHILHPSPHDKTITLPFYPTSQRSNATLAILTYPIRPRKNTKIKGL
nr:hypothetical protein [Tanacetum cinerariifolium]